MKNILFLVCLSICMHCFGQEVIIHASPGDFAELETNETEGSFQWQYSYEGVSWMNVDGQTTSHLHQQMTQLPIQFRLKISKESCDDRYSSNVIFQLKAAEVTLPVVSTNAVANITLTSASGGGNISDDGGGTISARGIIYSTSPLPDLNDHVISNGTGTGNFSSTMESLTPSTQYYVRAYATNEKGTAYGDQLMFTTQSAIFPVLNSVATISISSSSFSVSSGVASNGGGTISAKGFVYSTSHSPTIGNSTVIDIGVTEEFAAQATGLNPLTQYYVRAFATNEAGTAYSEEVTCTTSSAALPSLGPVDSYSVTASSFLVSSSITEIGGSAVSAKGFVYSTAHNPTIGNGTVINSSLEEEFAKSISGLNPGTEYFVRAFAANSFGTSYSIEVKIKTLATNTILMFVSHEDTYYSEYIVMKKALEASGFSVDVRSAGEGPTSTYMLPPGTTIDETAATLPGGSYVQFQSQFESLFNANWDGTENASPSTIPVDGKIQDVTDMTPYRALVIAGGTGALAYRVDGAYASQGVGEKLITAAEIEAAALKLNGLAIETLTTGKPVMAQCHAASLPVFWRIPGTSGAGVETLGFSLLKEGSATGFPEPETPTTLSQFGVTHKPNEKVVISSPPALANWPKGKSRIITTQDWYPQTVAHAARTLLNILESYPDNEDLSEAIKVLVVHGGEVVESNCSPANRTNDVPCNHGTGSDIPADYRHIKTLINADSPADDFSFEVSDVNLLENHGLFNDNSKTSVASYLQQFDVIVFFKHWSSGVTVPLQQAILEFVDAGGGYLSLHHGAYNDVDGSNNKNILLHDMVGVESTLNGFVANLTTFNTFITNHGHFISSYAMNYDNDLQSPAPWSSNALTSVANNSYSWLPVFSVYDELYNNMTFTPGQNFGRNVNEITPIFSNDQFPASQSHTTGFVKNFNPSGDTSIGKVAHFQIGERKESININHRYGQVVRNAIVWLADH